jgi:hypothetical protein
MEKKNGTCVFETQFLENHFIAFSVYKEKCTLTLLKIHENLKLDGTYFSNISSSAR